MESRRQPVSCRDSIVAARVSESRRTGCHPLDRSPSVPDTIAIVNTSRSNNLDAIRLVAALTVLVGHAWPLSGTPHAPRVAGIPIFTLAVYVFFAASGFLITKSWIRLQDVRTFLRHRVMRIFPALLVLIIVTVLLVGPMVTTLSLPEYAGNPGTWTYLVNVTLVATYALPGVFLDHPRPVVNGSLWTLGPEFVCYLAVLVIGLSSRLAPQKANRAVGIVIVSTMTAVIVALGLTVSPHSPLRDTLTAVVFFGVGSIIGRLSPKGLPLAPAVGGLTLWLVVGSVAPAWSVPLAWLAIPVAVVGLGLRSAPVIRRAGRFGDLSYGTYLWGYLIEQLVIAVFPDIGVAGLIVIAAPVTLVIAYVSWRLIERPSLAWARGNSGSTREPPSLTSRVGV